MLNVIQVCVPKLAVRPEIVGPYMRQFEFEPVALLCHRMSDLPSPSKSPTPVMLQLRSVTAPKTGWLKIVAPFMNQIEISPVTPLRHRMSDLPSPSKSPLPAMRQLRSVTVAKLVAPPEIVVPFMSQIEFEPVALLCHRMSDLPSPSKSPPPAMLQLRSLTAPKTASLHIVVPLLMQNNKYQSAPLLNQIEISRVFLFYCRVYDLAPPSLSTRRSLHLLRSVTVAKLVAPPEIVVPFMSQIEFEPVALLCHRMSDLPSPLKSLRMTRRPGVVTETGTAVQAE